MSLCEKFSVLDEILKKYGFFRRSALTFGHDTAKGAQILQYERGHFTSAK